MAIRRVTLKPVVVGIEVTGITHAVIVSIGLPGILRAAVVAVVYDNMLATGIKTPVGIKIMGADLKALSELAERTASLIRTIPDTLSAYPERTFGGYYLDIDLDRDKIARYGLTVGDVQEVVRTAIGGTSITM